MHKIKGIICRKVDIKRLLLFETAIVIIYGLTAAATFSVQELSFGENDMQLRRYDNNTVEGNYLDTSFTDTKAVVTPAFQLRKGIYYVEATYTRHGIVNAGLIYDVTRNGKELVDNDEFTLSPDKQECSYRVRIHDDSAIRFKLRLTGDAVEGDYIQLQQVHIIASRLTYVYRIFCLVLFLLVLDLVVWGYVRFYSKWTAERKTVFLVLAITAFFTGLPLYRSGLSHGSDLMFHLSRLDGIYRSMKFAGLGDQFPVRVQSGWLDGNGYAVSVFYGDIFMYFPALMRAVGFTLEEAYKAYAEMINIATVFLSFYAFRKITKDDLSAMIGSVLYSGCAQRLVLLYTAMLGMAGGMVFFPLIIAGFYLLFTEDTESGEYKRIWVLLTIGFTGILMTHMISCLIVGGYSVLLCIIMIRKVMRKNTLRELFKAAGAAVLLNLWYLVPFIQYMFQEELRINSKLAGKGVIRDYYAHLEDFRQVGRNFYSFFVDNNMFGFSLLFVLLLYLITIPVQKQNRQTGYGRIIAVFVLFASMACTNLLPVVELARRSRLLLKFFTTIQYQDRLMSAAVALAACLAAVYFAMDLFDRKMRYLIIGLLCCITFGENLQYFSTLSSDGIYSDSIVLESRPDKETYGYNVGNGEYLPAITVLQNITEEVQGDEQVRIDHLKRDGLSFDLDVENVSSEEQQILFPVLYYGGYQARDSDSHEKLVVKMGDNGRVAVTVPPNYRGTLHLGYYEPMLWRMAEIISVVMLAGLILFLCMPGHKIRLVQIRLIQNRKGRILQNGD